MIPRIIHQIWVGPLEPPYQWTETWPKLHPGWEYRLWREADLDALEMRNRRAYDYFYKTTGQMPGAADVARAEILSQFGGVYVDADTECLVSFEGAPFMNAGFFTTHAGPGSLGPGWLTAGVVGAIPHHAVIETWMDMIARAKFLQPPWLRVCGAVSHAVAEHRDRDDIMLLPPGTFYPKHYSGVSVPTDGTVYADHHWGTARGIFRPGATPEQRAVRRRDHYIADLGEWSGVLPSSLLRVAHKAQTAARKLTGRRGPPNHRLAD